MARYCVAIMTKSYKPLRYHTYLVSVWEERSHNGCVTHQWRYVLEDPCSGHRRGYVTLQDLLDGLLTQLTTIQKEGGQE